MDEKAPSAKSICHWFTHLKVKGSEIKPKSAGRQRTSEGTLNVYRHHACGVQTIWRTGLPNEWTAPGK